MDEGDVHVFDTYMRVHRNTPWLSHFPSPCVFARPSCASFISRVYADVDTFHLTIAFVWEAEGSLIGVFTILKRKVKRKDSKCKENKQDRGGIYRELDPPRVIWQHRLRASYVTCKLTNLTKVDLALYSHGLPRVI